MADETKPEDVSPTGKAMVSPKLVPFFFAGFLVATAVAGASMADLGLPPKVAAWAGLIAVIFAALLGITPGLRKMVVLLCLGSTLSLSCATANPLIATGESIHTAAVQYHEIVGLMDVALNAKLINDEQYHQWRLFSDHFELSLEWAQKIWESARKQHDDIMQQQAGAIIDRLSAQLGQYKGGVP